jgi:hypothetical protein
MLEQRRATAASRHRSGVLQRDAADEMDDRLVRCCCLIAALPPELN